MPEAPARIWYQQAFSDWQASQRLLVDEDATTYCHAISKCQQAVEKAVKAMQAALRERGLLTLSTRKDHSVEVELAEIMSAIRRAPQSHAMRGLISYVQTLLYSSDQYQINELCALAPKWPGPGALFPKNTEYPYQLDANAWQAPAEKSAFNSAEQRKYAALVRRIVTGASKVLAAAQR